MNTATKKRKRAAKPPETAVCSIEMLSWALDPLVGMDCLSFVIHRDGQVELVEAHQFKEDAEDWRAGFNAATGRLKAIGGQELLDSIMAQREAVEGGDA